MKSQSFDGTNLCSTDPFYKLEPYQFHQNEIFFITFKTDPEIIRALVPEPLKPIGDEIQVAFNDLNLVSPFKVKYMEVLMSIPVSLKERYGSYMPVLYLDAVEGIIPGREIAGFNKVGAEIQIEQSGGNVSINVFQMDTLIIEATFILGEPFPPPEQPDGGTFNLKYIPSIIDNAPPEVKQLTFTKSETRETIEFRIGQAHLNFYSSFYNPLGKIEIREITQVGYIKNSFDLTEGEIVYDYLKNPLKQ